MPDMRGTELCRPALWGRQNRTNAPTHHPLPRVIMTHVRAAAKKRGRIAVDISLIWRLSQKCRSGSVHVAERRGQIGSSLSGQAVLLTRLTLAGPKTQLPSGRESQEILERERLTLFWLTRCLQREKLGRKAVFCDLMLGVVGLWWYHRIG